MTVDLVLNNAKVYINGNVVEAGIAIENGKIAKIAKETNLPSASSRIDLKRCLALPGLIDAHVHLRDQLQAYKESFFSGTAAAVAGGFASVLDMPNNRPVTMDSMSLRERVQRAKNSIVANVGFFSAFPSSLTEIAEIVKEGIVAFKIYLASNIGGLDVDDDEALRHAFDNASKHGVPVALHAEDKKEIASISEIEKKLGHNDFEAYIKAHSPRAEVKAIERILKIIINSVLHVHFCHVSSIEAVNIIKEARSKGLKVSCEVTPHHLLLTIDDLRRQGTILLTDPPVRDKSVADKLWRATQTGVIDIIASDHAPHQLAEKRASSVWDVKPGIPELETSLPLLLTKVNEGQLTIKDLVQLMAERPARIFQLQGEGFLRENYNANITVVDLNRKGKISVDRFYSEAKYSPFDGWRVKGMPVRTFVNGHLAMDEGEIIAKAGTGEILKRKIF